MVSCTPVDSIEDEVNSEDRAVFQADSIKYFSYIIERDSLKLIENPDEEIKEKIEILDKEVRYYQDKWGKYLN
jgi:hypothetical protein